MSVDMIIRVRGDAPNLVWPKATIRAPLKWRAELRHLRPDAPPPGAELRERTETRQLERQWAAAHLEERRRCSEIFGAAQGWKLAAEPLPATRLLRPADRRAGARPWAFCDDVFDHPEWYRVGRRAAAAVVHLYGPMKLDALPEQIVVDQLPESWYYPGWTTGYVLRPAP